MPAQTFIRSILHNPIYAGAYVYGQRQRKIVLSEGQIVKRTGNLLQPEQCRVFIRDHHEGYIGWDEFEENQKRLRSNALRLGSDESVSVIREGHGLLSGLLRCGRCGRKMHVRYWGKSGPLPDIYARETSKLGEIIALVLGERRWIVVFRNFCST